MINRKTVRKLWLVWDFEKEEQWLNNMAMEGWALDGVGFGTYHFVPCEPGEYTIRLEMKDKNDAYIRFMEETGAEYVGRCVQWIFFRKKAEYGEFEIFSDIDSRIAHLQRMGKTFFAIGMANIAIGLVNTFNPVNCGFINLLCGCIMMYALGRVHGKVEEMKKERTLHE